MQRKVLIYTFYFLFQTRSFSFAECYGIGEILFLLKLELPPSLLIGSQTHLRGHFYLHLNRSESVGPPTFELPGTYLV